VKRHGLFIGLSVLLAVSTVGSILFTPSVSRLQAIPVYARLIYSKQSPDNLLSVFTNLGQSAVLQRSWFRWLEHYPLTVATVPFGGREQRDTWVVVSELGGPAALAMRWKLMLFPPEGVSPVRSYASWSVWKMEHSSIPSWARVRFAITEGLLICSVSSDSHDIYRLLDTADGRAVSLCRKP